MQKPIDRSAHRSAAAAAWPGLLLAIITLLLASTLRAAEEIAPDQPRPRSDINAKYLAPDLDVARWEEIFEGEAREIFRNRQQIVEALELSPGMRVADVGAGTGLFTSLFARAVGSEGKVYAIDISPRFLEHLRQRFRAEELPQVAVVEGTGRSIEVPESSVDLVYICDTYHHFEQPSASLASIRSALRPGGSLVVVDFERIPGVTKKWIMEHVRAGKKTTIEEIESEGFALDAELSVDGLRENYALRFRRVESADAATEGE